MGTVISAVAVSACEIILIMFIELPACLKPLSSRRMSIYFFTFLITFVVWPTLVNLFLLSLIYQTVVRLFVSILRPKMELMKGMSVILAAQSSHKEPKLNLVYHLICSGSISLDQLRRQFQYQVLDFKDKGSRRPYSHLCYTWRSMLGVTFWEMDRKFDLCKHIKLYNVDSIIAMPSPCTEEDLVNITGKLVVKSYSDGSSPWELLLIPKFVTKEGVMGSVVILRIHHVLADGLSAMGLIHRLFGTAPPAPLAKFPQLWRTEKFLRNVYIALKAPYDLARFTIDSNDELNAWSLPRKGGDYVTLCSERIPWGYVKKIMEKYSVGSNAVVYAIAAGVVVRLMKDGGQKIPEKIAISAAYPLPDHPDGLCNHLSAQYAMFRPAVDVGEALVRTLGRQIKPANVFNTLPHTLSAGIYLQSHFPLWLLKRIVKVKSTLAFSHFPGPLTELGAPGLGRLLDIIPCCGVGQTGSLAIMVSTAGQLRIVLTVDTRIFSGLSVTFANYVNEGLRELLMEGVNEACYTPRTA